jgi:ParB-like chromosome segregation protein Spo0J
VSPELCEWRALLDSGKISGLAEIARREGLSRVRITQIMSLLHLAPETQDYILSMPKTSRRPAITERSLRPITQIECYRKQNEAFSALLDSSPQQKDPQNNSNKPKTSRALKTAMKKSYHLTQKKELRKGHEGQVGISITLLPCSLQLKGFLQEKMWSRSPKKVLCRFYAGFMQIFLQNNAFCCYYFLKNIRTL